MRTSSASEPFRGVRGSASLPFPSAISHGIGRRRISVRTGRPAGGKRNRGDNSTSVANSYRLAPPSHTPSSTAAYSGPAASVHDGLSSPPRFYYFLVATP